MHRLRALGRTLTLRWSPACHAGWAEVQPAQGTSELLVDGDDRARQTATAGAAWTAMIPGGPHHAALLGVVGVAGDVARRDHAG
ncbi:hypothetical protein N4G69_21005 [Streptomyces mirabilis]|nr:hypothetical protein [Streptomyces mirabilis]